MTAMKVCIEDEILEALREVEDPELGVNIVDLGLILAVEVDESRVGVKLLMTTPTCPIAGLIAETARVSIERRLGDAYAVRITIDRLARWSPERATEEVRALFASRPSPLSDVLDRFTSFLVTR